MALEIKIHGKKNQKSLKIFKNFKQYLEENVRIKEF